MNTARRVAGITAIIIGLGFVIGTFALDGFNSATAGQQLIDTAAPALSDEALQQGQTDVVTLRTALEEFNTVVLPATSGKVNLEKDYPAISAGLPQSQATVTFANNAVNNLKVHQDDFKGAQDFPFPGLPLTAGPFIAVVLGLVLTGVGVAILLRRGQSASLVGLVVLGGLMFLSPLATGMIAKASGTQSLVSSLNISEPVAKETRTRLQGMDALAIEYDTKLLPALPQYLGMTNEEFADWLKERAPALSSISPGFHPLVNRFAIDLDVREKGVPLFAVVRDKPISLLPWLFIVPGVVLLVTSGTALLLGRRSEAGLRNHPHEFAPPGKAE